MNKKFVRIFISVVAAVALVTRFLVPSLRVDNVTLWLLVLLVFPWLSAVLKTIELPGGFKIELQEHPDDNKKTVNSDTTKTQLELPALSARAKEDDYFTKLLKLTPVETIAAYLIIRPMIQTIPFFNNIFLTWVAFFVALIITPIYLPVVVRVFSKIQIMITTIGFVAWALALGSPFTSISWFHPIYGAVALLTYYLVGPLIIPKPYVRNQN